MKIPHTIAHAGLVEPEIQYAALPWRFTDKLEIMLITSRRTRRWVIPKGWPMIGRKPYATAAIEAMEEAGLLGKIDKESLGFFHYKKKIGNGEHIVCCVHVFALRVERQKKNWPEKNQRLAKWFSVSEASRLVQEPELTELIQDFRKPLSKQIKKNVSHGDAILIN